MPPGQAPPVCKLAAVLYNARVLDGCLETCALATTWVNNMPTMTNSGLTASSPSDCCLDHGRHSCPRTPLASPMSPAGSSDVLASQRTASHAMITGSTSRLASETTAGQPACKPRTYLGRATMA